MDLTVQLFAGLKESFEREAIQLPAHDDLTVGELKQRLMDAFPDHREQIARALVAVNQTYADDTVRVTLRDEVALIPPVGGGSPARLPSCLITHEPLDVQEAFAQLEDVYCGGTVLFCGTVREWTRGRRTTHLEYEAYVEMALQQMQRIEADVKQRWPGVITLQWHRIGRLEPTDVAVICAAAAPHRADAFEAARELIERLKKEVPIWKKEYYADGGSEWRENATSS